MIARTAPFATGDETFGQDYYAVLAEPNEYSKLAYCLVVYLPRWGCPQISCRHVSPAALDEAAPCTEGQFLAAFTEAQHGQLTMLGEARAFGVPKPAAAPTHLVTTCEAVALTDEERPAYWPAGPDDYPF